MQEQESAPIANNRGSNMNAGHRHNIVLPRALL